MGATLFQWRLSSVSLLLFHKCDFQIRLTFDLKNPDNIAVEKDNSGNPHYLLTSTSDVVVTFLYYK